jgi:hypothetical protein
MFQNVGHTGGIGGNGSENHTEGVFPVLIGNMKMPGPGLFVHQLDQCRIDDGQVRNRLDLVMVNTLAGGVGVSGHKKGFPVD